MTHGDNTTVEPTTAVPVSTCVMGAGGGTTRGLSVDVAFCPSESVTVYASGVAAPTNVEIGANCTVPSAITV